MQKALALAIKAQGKTSPNPLVGAVVEKGGRVIAQGFHKKAGMPHAEAEALKEAGRKARGACLYVNLEPCCHFGRTPPCVDKIISSGIKRVVMSVLDPNPLVYGRSVKILRKHNIEVRTGVLAGQAKKLNEVFFKNMRRHLPFTAVKFAQSLDGRLTDNRGNSKWITSLTARRSAKHLRQIYDAVLVGINTVLKDNPHLDAPGKVMSKIILDPHFRIERNLNIFRKYRKIIVFAGEKYKNVRKEKKLAGAEVIYLKAKNGIFSIKQILSRLYSRQITSVFVEGGAETLGRFFDAECVDKVYIFAASKIIGGKNALCSVAGRGVSDVNKAFDLNIEKVESLGRDFLITAYPKK